MCVNDGGRVSGEQSTHRTRFGRVDVFYLDAICVAATVTTRLPPPLDAMLLTRALSGLGGERSSLCVCFVLLGGRWRGVEALALVVGWCCCRGVCVMLEWDKLIQWDVGVRHGIEPHSLLGPI